jgi:hypothetical protein
MLTGARTPPGRIIATAGQGIPDSWDDSVALFGARAVIGSDWRESHTGQQRGAAFVLDDGGSGFAQTQTLIAPPATRAAFNQFGSDVTLDATRIGVGEAGADGSSDNAGRAHVVIEDAGASFGDGLD